MVRNSVRRPRRVFCRSDQTTSADGDLHSPVACTPAADPWIGKPPHLLWGGGRGRWDPPIPLLVLHSSLAFVCRIGASRECYPACTTEILERDRCRRYLHP